MFKHNSQGTSEGGITWEKRMLVFFPAHTQRVVKLGNFFTKVYIIQINSVLPYEKILGCKST